MAEVTNNQLWTACRFAGALLERGSLPGLATALALAIACFALCDHGLHSPKTAGG
jgi:hypothetical protein